MAAPYLSTATVTHSLSVVTNIITTKNPNLSIYPISTKGSGETSVFDLEGTVKTIKVIGHFIGTTDILAAKKLAFEELANGNQQTPYTFGSNLGGQVKVKIMDISFSESAGSSNKLDYEMNLVESK